MTEEKKNSRRNRNSMVEDVRYYGVIPKRILKEMTPEIIEQYYLWDEVAKKEIERYPLLMLPLIQEVFHKAYPKDVEIRLLATEYVVRRIHKETGSTLNSIFADIAVQVGDRDIYHMECQMRRDKRMALRMFEYDIHIGLVHGIGDYSSKMDANDKPELIMPRSVILYLDSADRMPSEESCLIRFADGTTHEYRIPVMYVQSYTPQMILEKHLAMLIPFLPIRFRKYLKRKKNGAKQPVSASERKELTEFIRECIMIIEREKENGTLTDALGGEIMELLDMTCGHLLKNEPELKKEVHGIMRPIVMLQRERAENEFKKEREVSIQKLIKRCCASGQSRQEVQESIQDIFSLDEAEAEEKVEKYWIEQDE